MSFKSQVQHLVNTAEKITKEAGQNRLVNCAMGIGWQDGLSLDGVPPSFLPAKLIIWYMFGFNAARDACKARLERETVSFTNRMGELHSITTTVDG